MPIKTSHYQIPGFGGRIWKNSSYTNWRRTKYPFYGVSFLFHKIPVNEKCLTQLFYLSDRPHLPPPPAKRYIALQQSL